MRISDSIILSKKGDENSMPQKPQLALYEYEAEKYIANLVTRKGNTAGDSEKQKTRRALAYMTALLKERGHSWPDESDYKAYRAGSNSDNKVIDENISRIEKFFAWLKKETERMPENGTTATLDAETSQPEMFSELDTQGVEASASTNTESETWPESDTKSDTGKATKKKPGRKVFDTENGEKKDKKLMMYFTPALFDEIRDWCYLKRISAVSYITSLIEADLHTPDKRDKIAFFRQLSNDA